MVTETEVAKILDVTAQLPEAVQPDCLVGALGMTRHLAWQVSWYADGEHQGVTWHTRGGALRYARRSGVLAVVEQVEDGQSLTLLCSPRTWRAYCRTHP
ncbi:MAG TPA: hypothetical protein VF832_02785, partial [Longimicrobiales bacterium]